jgi:purine nucleoside phosphorylase
MLSIKSSISDFSIIENPVEISYADIPYFQTSTVKGHDGKLIFGKIYGKDVVAMSTIEELPATISALSSEMGIADVVLSGNIVTYNTLLSDNIIQYSKLNYNQNEIKVEVVK